MSDIEKRAREKAEALIGEVLTAALSAGEITVNQARAVNAALEAALAPPEGYVLVPVEPTTAMMEAAGRVVFQEAGQQWSDSAGFAEGFVVETQRLCHAAMLAARPEVP
ncbi:hypothetical protein [Stenotrophomonas sp. AS1]|uniref:hypothetical protein n=1 Tax=Stenotrophomonas sp. AS1 TaxID=3029188 RepID=UPI003B772CB5